MLKLPKNQWVRLGAVSTLTALLGAAIAAAITLGSLSGPSTGDHVFLTSGGNVAAPSRANIPATAVASQELSLTAAEAIAAGWKDPILCSPGRGRYFQKGKADEGPPYMLMYDTDDQLIGVYLFSRNEMPLPWGRWEELRGGGGLTIIDFEHWGLLVNLRDPARACTKSEGKGNLASRNLDDSGSAVKSTPTPYVAPTPTPTAGALLQAAGQRMTGIKSFSFTLTSDPPGAPPMPGIDVQKVNGTIDLAGQVTLQMTGATGAVLDIQADSLPFQFGDIAVVLGKIAQALQGPSDSPSVWIDNVQSRGVSGTVLGQQLRALFPSAISDVSVTVRMWVDDRHQIRRVRIEGPVVPNDAPDSVRVLDLGDFE